MSRKRFSEGEIEHNGQNHKTFIMKNGLEVNWGWDNVPENTFSHTQNKSFLFTIKADGTGLYYDFEKNGVKVKGEKGVSTPAMHFQCRKIK